MSTSRGVARLACVSAAAMVVLVAVGGLTPSWARAASAASIEAEYATDVAASSATFSAFIEPHGVKTGYSLEYGTSTSYGYVVNGNAGEDASGGETVDVHVQSLHANTVYHYRFVTSSECEAGKICTTDGADREVKTQLAIGQEELPDGRAWELVSPANKQGAVFQAVPTGSGIIEAATDGGGIAYVASTPLGEGPTGSTVFDPTVSLRDGNGWSTVSMSPTARQPGEGTMDNQLALAASAALVFSPDLGIAVFDPAFHQLPAGLSRSSVYVRGTVGQNLTPLVTCANVEVSPCPEFGGGDEERREMGFVGATPDLRYIVVESPYALTPTAVSGVASGSEGESFNLYEWRGDGVDGCAHTQGCLVLVNVLPNGKPTEGVKERAYLGRTDSLTAQAVSREGRWIVWSAGPSDISEVRLYVRDMIGGKSARVGGVNALFQGMSGDGSRVFYTENGELYVCEPRVNTSNGQLECAVRDLTASHPGASSAGVKDAVVGISDDGAYVYFVASSSLAARGVSGEDNLYVLHRERSSWTTRLVATLASYDEKDWYCKSCGALAGIVTRKEITSRISRDGRYAAFMSERPLTGYDNHDAFSGQPDDEVFLYDAGADAGKGRLVCASCDPTGARPVGVNDAGPPFPLVDPNAIWTSGLSGKDHWLAASIPGWDQGATPGLLGEAAVSPYEPRYLSDGGRLFFDSADGLVPQDTNGLMDVYEYEPVGGTPAPASDACSASSATFSESAGGCVSLLSAGTSSEESAFMDASETGDDAFFLTASRLVGKDVDAGFDVYDAHVCSAAVPCVVEPEESQTCRSGDSCKPAPSPQPAIFAAPPSTTFDGQGNVTPTGGRVSGKRGLSSAQKLARALRACRKKGGGRRKRARCELRARKRYAARRSNVKRKGA